MGPGQGGPREASPAPPPWTCRLRAVVRLGLGRGHVTALAVVAYDATPVGPYGEALLAQVRPPLRLTVPWIVVDSAASAAAGRRNWALPKHEADLSVEVHDRRAAARVAGLPDPDLLLRARAVGPALALRCAAVLEQPGRGPAPLRWRGRARPALVHVDGGPAPGTGPGALLEGVLHLAAPQDDRTRDEEGPAGCSGLKPDG
jgi:hypothetical protein